MAQGVEGDRVSRGFSVQCDFCFAEAPSSIFGREDAVMRLHEDEGWQQVREGESVLDKCPECQRREGLQ